MAWMAVLLAAAMACAKPPSAPPARDAGPVREVSVDAPAPRVIFPDGYQVKVEVVADDELRAQGLMYRDHLSDDRGMLFLFPADGEYSFWMKNTMIPLDIIWIETEGLIVHVAHDVPPCEVEDCPSYAPGSPARYVLEVAAGVARDHGLEPGKMLRFEDVDLDPSS